MTADPCQEYAQFFETICPENLGRLSALTAENIHFKDPFNDVIGQDAMRAIFEKMFNEVETPAFSVSHIICENNICFIRWRFTGTLNLFGKHALALEGVSEITVDEDGRVTEHIDHWDAMSQFLLRMPVFIRLLMVIFRSRISH